MGSNIRMSDKVFNYMFPIGGGASGAFGTVITNISWQGIGDMALQAAIFALVGGLIGWSVKFILDKIFKKK